MSYNIVRCILLFDMKDILYTRFQTSTGDFQVSYIRLISLHDADDGPHELKRVNCLTMCHGEMQPNNIGRCNICRAIFRKVAFHRRFILCSS